ncbi:MAG: adenosylcobinamide-GDP ribazoletransferase [Rhodospirillaceae bacterium]|nr:adenosylcobinamide-GDP ribazoletransferase [Rhodospirillaceae bacterium]|tara:strand:+ start:34795 stop:35550 length:756 start_codon:yes stop_codon:yes gene_type:complete
MAVWTEVKLCLGLLTRLPVDSKHDEPAADVSAACKWFPVIGVMIGALSGAALFIGDILELPDSVSALLAISAVIILTGAMHEDGLADVADGFGGGRDKKHKLEIMRDSRLGVYGTIALILDVAFRWALITQLLSFGWIFATACLIASGASSRLVVISLMKSLTAARQDGLGASAGIPDNNSILIAILFTVIALLLTKDTLLFLSIAISVPIAAGLLHYLANNQIGGQTGDVLGAGQRLGEVLALTSMVVVA